MHFCSASPLVTAIVATLCLASLSSLAHGQSAPIPPSQPTGTCVSQQIHKEWRELTSQEQQSYLAAVVCLRRAPSRLAANGAVSWGASSMMSSASGNSTRDGGSAHSTSAYNDLVWVHMQANRLAHMTAAFLPWHRLFLSVHDNIMRTDCNYSGPFPYWDWSVDSQAPEQSSVWNTNAFGGNGGGANACITTGFMAQMQAQFPDPHCINRRWLLGPQSFQGQEGGSMLGAFYSPMAIQFILNGSPSYTAFRVALEDHPHNLIHAAVGGDMSGTSTSTNDPIFFLHHRNLDRLWAVWQQQHPNLASTYGGNRNRETPEIDDAVVSDIMEMYGLAESAPVSQVLSTLNGGANGRMCYQYSLSVSPNSASPPRPLVASQVAVTQNGGSQASDNQEILSNSAADVGVDTTLDTTDATGMRKRSLGDQDMARLIRNFRRYDSTIGSASTEKQTGPSASRVNRRSVEASVDFKSHGSPFNHVTPNPYDRDDWYNLRSIPSLSDTFLHNWMHNEKDISRIRKSESQIRRFIDYVNAADGFVSSACLGEYQQTLTTGWHSITQSEYSADLVLRNLMVEGAELAIGRISQIEE
ncbi:hypothetical protein BASA83_001070 [Batrachochytrium salamandrivorans]|nr:hypothetical protein BASA81_012210 [Batrachochytrium salamandrivorans]KAH9276379.1 hypothetical protein BASA83_001070 [Batrachochytrium salamandrivorans]